MMYPYSQQLLFEVDTRLGKLVTNLPTEAEQLLM